MSGQQSIDHLCPPTPEQLETQLKFMDCLAEFLGNSDGQTADEIRAELIEEMGEERFLEAERKMLAHVKAWKERTRKHGH